jgi:hypothetical protein
MHIMNHLKREGKVMSRRTVSIVILAVVATWFMAPAPSYSGPFGEALGGALKGAVLGSLVGGRDGAAAGAAIGGAAGLATGIDRENRQRKQAEIAEQRRKERAELEKQRQKERELQEEERNKEAEETQGYDPMLISEIQRSLIRLGYDPGPVGRMNPKTEEAVRSYQADKGLLVTGNLSQELLKHMIQNGG